MSKLKVDILETLDGTKSFNVADLSLSTIPVVDNLTSTSGTTALSANQGRVLKGLVDNKQDALSSGTNIKTVNSTSLLGSGDVAVQATLVSGTNIKTVNSTSLLGSGNVAVQATLVSGTNIKTINGTSLLGSGDIAVSASNARELLTAARAYYVRSDGSDSNNGLANTSGGAFLTIQKAVDVAASLDLGVYDVTIYVGTGTWATPLTLRTLVGAGKVVIRGINADTTSTVLSTTSAPIVSGAFLGKYRLQYLKLQTTTSGDCIQGAGAGSAIEYLNVDFGACASNHVYAGSGGFVQAVGSYSISGGAQTHFCAVDCATVVITGFTVTLTGTPTFTNAFAVVSRAAAAQSASTTYSGTATGKRYDVYSNGVLTTLGGASYLPGSVAGTTATGGVYQ